MTAKGERSCGQEDHQTVGNGVQKGRRYWAAAEHIRGGGKSPKWVMGARNAAKNLAGKAR